MFSKWERNSHRVRIGIIGSTTTADGVQSGLVYSFLGTVIGSLVLPAIIGGIHKLRTKKLPSIRFIGITYLICSLLALMGGFNLMNDRGAQSKAFTESLDIIVDGRVNLKDWEPIAYDRQTYGEYAELGATFQEYSLKCNQMNQQVIDELQNTDYTKVISPSSLDSVNEVRESIQRIERLIENTEAYANRLKSINEEYDAKFENLTISDSIKNKFIENQWREAKAYEVSISETFGKIKNPMGDILKLLEFMESKQGEYAGI